MLIPSHNLHAVSSAGGDTGNPGNAIRNAQPVKCSLKPEVAYHTKRWYPTKLEAKKKKGLQRLIDKFLKHGLLVLYPSPGSTPILPVVKPNGEYRME